MRDEFIRARNDADKASAGCPNCGYPSLIATLWDGVDQSPANCGSYGSYVACFNPACAYVDVERGTAPTEAEIRELQAELSERWEVIRAAKYDFDGLSYGRHRSGSVDHPRR